MREPFRDVTVRDSQGNAIDPASLESDEPPELKEQAEQQQREGRWTSLTRRWRPWGSGGWWWHR